MNPKKTIALTVALALGSLTGCAKEQAQTTTPQPEAIDPSIRERLETCLPKTGGVAYEATEGVYVDDSGKARLQDGSSRPATPKEAMQAATNCEQAQTRAETARGALEQCLEDLHTQQPNLEELCDSNTNNEEKSCINLETGGFTIYSPYGQMYAPGGIKGLSEIGANEMLTTCETALAEEN